MNKCTNCGTEFDGNFCPQCGQKRAGEITCPHCGNKVANDANFCLMCGQRIVQPHYDDNMVNTRQKGNNADRSAFAARMFGILRYVPMALAVLFAVLLPLLYIAPIAEASEMMGAVENINVYSLDEDFYGVSVAYLVFMVLALLLAVVLLYLHINKDKRNKYITLFGKVRITVGELASLLAVVLVYLPCLIISAVTMGDVAELNEMLGGGLMEAVSAGAAPKAVLSFAVIFTVFAICAVVALILIAKANPELLPVDEDDDEPTEVKPCRKPLLYYAYLNTKLRRTVLLFFIFSFLTAVVLTICFWNFLSNNYAIISPHWVIVCSLAVTIIVVIWSLALKEYDFSPDEFLNVVQKKDWHNECKLGIKKAILFIIPLVAMILTHISNAVKTGSAYSRGYIMATVYVTVTAIVYIIAKIAIAVQSGYIAEYLFGVAGPAPNSPLRVEFDFDRELDAYKTYMAAKKNGIAIADNDFTKKKALVRRLMLSVACCVFVAISVVSAVVSPLLADKFSASFLSSVVDADKHYDIEHLLGEPNETANDNTILIYYDDDYADLQSQIKKAQDASDVKRLQALNAKAEKLIFNSLEIHFIKSSQGRELYSIILNTKTTVGKTQKKTLKNAKLFDAKYNERGYTAENFYAEIFYTDGSYKYEPVPTSAFSTIDFTKKGSQTVKWSDEWGSYSATVKSE